MSSENEKYYLNSNEFFTAIMESRMDGKISEKLARMFILLSERNANHRNFVGYHHLRDEFILIGQLACVNGFKHFRPFKDAERSKEWEENKEPIDYNYQYCSNSFAFFTTCIRNAIIQHLKSEYNQSNIKNKQRIQMGLDPSFGYSDMIKEQEEAERQDRDDVGGEYEETSLFN